VSLTLSEDDLTFEITSETLRVPTHGLTSASFGGPTPKYGCYVPRRRVSLGAPNDVVVPTVPWRVGLRQRPRSSRLRDASPPFGLMGSGRGRSTYGRPPRPSLQESATPLIASIFLSSSMVPIRQPCGTTWATRAGVPSLRGRSASRACPMGLLLPDFGTA